jgi:hypothetical protein
MNKCRNNLINKWISKKINKNKIKWIKEDWVNECKLK